MPGGTTERSTFAASAGELGRLSVVLMDQLEARRKITPAVLECDQAAAELMPRLRGLRASVAEVRRNGNPVPAGLFETQELETVLDEVLARIEKDGEAGPADLELLSAATGLGRRIQQLTAAFAELQESP